MGFACNLLQFEGTTAHPGSRPRPWARRYPAACPGAVSRPARAARSRSPAAVRTCVSWSSREPSSALTYYQGDNTPHAAPSMSSSLTLFERAEPQTQCRRGSCSTTHPLDLRPFPRSRRPPRRGLLLRKEQARDDPFLPTSPNPETVAHYYRFGSRLRTAGIRHAPGHWGYTAPPPFPRARQNLPTATIPPRGLRHPIPGLQPALQQICLGASLGMEKEPPGWQNT